jgi:8-oxo-dGTP pyrophosphatase MutT (NUDIX family)
MIRRSFSTVGWIHVTHGELLLVRPRRLEVYYLPGGKLDPAETDEMALVREVWEELGVTLMPEDLACLGAFTGQAAGEPVGVTVTIRCYSGGVGSDALMTPRGEIADVATFTYDDYLAMPTTAPVVRDIMRHLRERGQIR